MKILLTAYRTEGIGGIPVHVHNLKTFLESKGHTVHLLSIKNTFVIPIPMLRLPSFIITSYIKAKRGKYDIIHAHDPIIPLGMGDAKVVLTIHNHVFSTFEALYSNVRRGIYDRLAINSLRKSDAITCVAKSISEYLDKHGWKSHYIPNGIRLDTIPDYSERLHDNQIIYAGRLAKDKDIDTLINVAKTLPDKYNLVIVGSGRLEIEEQISHLTKTHKNVEYLRQQSHKRTISLIRGSDVLIQPSIHEGISSTLLEAMACETPIITTRVMGSSELIQDKHNGLLVDPGDAQSIIQKIDLLLSDKNLCDQIIKAGNETAQKYSSINTGSMYLELYDSLLGKNN